MTRKVVLLLISLILILSVSACQLGAADEYETGDPIKQPINPEKQATPTPEPSQAIMANTGVHAYSITATENTCALTLKEPEQNIEIEFKGTTAIITHIDLETAETYGIAGEDRYSRINPEGKTIVINFSTGGFTLNIFDPEADPWIDDPCGFFTFSLNED